MTVRKIKIVDDDKIRNEISKLFESQEQIILAKWSLELAKHIIQITNFDIGNYTEIKEGFDINELWQEGKVRIYDVRKIGFKIHQIAREQPNEITKNTVRVIGQAVASGHMKEHSIVASDYAIKVINILYNNDMKKVKEERTWQLKKLIELSKS